jgi:hypothetical protein
VIHFKQVWFAFTFCVAIKHNVKTEDFKAHGVLKVI